VAKADLLTIGYQGTVLADVIGCLKSAGVTRLLDVRAIPQSRKPGFSKTLLGGSLVAEGIGYSHLRGLGTPKPGREAARRGDVAGLRAIFAAHMRSDAAQADLARAIAIVREDGTKACLLCFEADHRTCHRSIVAGLICEATGQDVEHLTVRGAFTDPT
jgi:uncharacterized protein (DUF488 family)